MIRSNCFLRRNGHSTKAIPKERQLRDMSFQVIDSYKRNELSKVTAEKMLKILLSFEINEIMKEETEKLNISLCRR